MGQRHIGSGRSARSRGADLHYAGLSETAKSYAPARLPAPQSAEITCCFALNAGTCLSSFRQRQSGRGQRFAKIWHGNGKPRQTTANRLRLVVEATQDDAQRIGGRACDPRLADLVRLLARQAARDFVEREAEAQGRTHREL